MEKFQVWASVLPSGTVTFELSYEELLQRQQGQYQQALSIRPGAVVTDLAVNIQVAEPAGLAYLRVLPLRTSRLLTNAISGMSAPTSRSGRTQVSGCLAHQGDGL